MEMTQQARKKFVVFRVTDQETMTLKLLARAEGTSQSELLRRLVQLRVKDLTQQRESTGSGESEGQQ